MHLKLRALKFQWRDPCQMKIKTQDGEANMSTEIHHIGKNGGNIGVQKK